MSVGEVGNKFVVTPSRAEGGWLTSLQRIPYFLSTISVFNSCELCYRCTLTLFKLEHPVLVSSGQIRV